MALLKFIIILCIHYWLFQEFSPGIKRSIGDSTDFTKDLKNWMSKLPPSLKSLPLIYLAIPGTHDSFTMDITSKSEVSPDAEDLLKALEWCGLAKEIMANWSKTQKLDAIGQLKAGIRYFDLRVCSKKGNDYIYFCHGLYSCYVYGILEDIASFLETHTGEVVILDCQHFYRFNKEYHRKLINIIIRIFGTKMLPYSNKMDDISLDYMTNQFKYQVIVIYRSDSYRSDEPLLWPGSCFKNPWADTINPTTLRRFLDRGIKSRSDKLGYISQCVLTPSTKDIIDLDNIFETLKQRLAIEFRKKRDKWISKQKPGPGGVNIIIGDFIEIFDKSFTKAVINLNLKLLSE